MLNSRSDWIDRAYLAEKVQCEPGQIRAERPILLSAPKYFDITHNLDLADTILFMRKKLGHNTLTLKYIFFNLCISLSFQEMALIFNLY